MKQLKILTGIALIFCILVFLLTILDYLALHDIYTDYVSPEDFGYLGITLPDLPKWTNTTGEWTAVGVSYFARFIFLILNTYVLVKLVQQFGKMPVEQKNA